MPEGDTVYRVARSLDAALAGRVVTSTDFRVPTIATVDLAGEQFRSVASRGKHLLMRIGDRVVHSHLKMEGEWLLFAAGERWRRPAWQARAIIEVPGVTAVGFDLGTLQVFAAAEERARLDHLGPDLLGPDWDADEAIRRIARAPDVSIAVALAEQRNLAGLGNVYVNELCFLRGILPTRPVAEVELEPLVRLSVRAIRANRDRVVRTHHRRHASWTPTLGLSAWRRAVPPLRNAHHARHPGPQRRRAARDLVVSQLPGVRAPGRAQLTGPVHFSPGPWPIASGMTDASRNASCSERSPSRSDRACMSLISGAPAVISPARALMSLRASSRSICSSGSSASPTFDGGGAHEMHGRGRDDLDRRHLGDVARGVLDRAADRAPGDAFDGGLD